SCSSTARSSTACAGGTSSPACSRPSSVWAAATSATTWSRRGSAEGSGGSEEAAGASPDGENCAPVRLFGRGCQRAQPQEAAMSQKQLLEEARLLRKARIQVFLSYGQKLLLVIIACCGLATLQWLGAHKATVVTSRMALWVGRPVIVAE